MRFLLMLQVSTAVLEKQTEEERTALYAGRREFQQLASEAGELISAQVLADPSTSTVVRGSSGGVPAVLAGESADEFLGGYYLVDVDSRQRAIELADLLPDARIDGHAVEIRPVMFSAAADF
ncbi:YciI family protein [Kribbella sancticallisti]|uniref:YciI family protein n=1 Tax=Kribbella sancticallisti TaxID=460087 RepID=A0ABN2E2R7_9ACTN